MSIQEPADRPTAAERSAREFDYGVGDALDSARQQVRLEIAARIRREATVDSDSSMEQRLAFERAARIAEQFR